MPGAKTAGWTEFHNAGSNLHDAMQGHMKGTWTDSDMLLQLASGLAGLIYGTEISLQELYERIERLHQKIDRVEKKIGSVPGSK
jgi:hypothetical protein